MVGSISPVVPNGAEGATCAASDVESRQSNESWGNDRDTVALFSAGIASSQAALYWLSRIGLPDSHGWLVLRCLCLSLFLLLLPAAVRLFSQHFTRKHSVQWWYSDAMLAMVGIFLLPLAGVLGAYLGVNAALPIEVLGLLVFAIIFIRWLTTGSFLKNVILMAAALLFGIALGGFFWGWVLKGYSPLIDEALLVGHNIFQDTFISASITAMIHTYGVPSTGLDGIPYCGHHFAVYVLFAGMCDLLGTNPLRFIQLGFPVIFVPFLFSRLLVFSIDLRELLYDHRSPGLRNEWLFWLILFAATIGFLPQEAADRTLSPGLGYAVVSLTYSVGLGFCFAILSLCTFLGKTYGSGTRALHASDRVLVFILPLLLLVLGMMKNSLMYSSLTILSYTFIRLRLWNNLGLTTALGLSWLMLFPVVKLTTNPGSASGGIYPMVLFISLVTLSWKPFFFVFHYFWSWAFIVWRLKRKRLGTLDELRQAFLGRHILDIEILVVACVVGSAPAFLLVIPGQSGTYFSAFQSWLALSLILARLPRLAASSFLAPSKANFRPWLGKATKLSSVLAGAIAACLLASVAVNAVSPVWRMIADNLSIRCAVMKSVGSVASCECLSDRIYRRLVFYSKRKDMSAIRQMLMSGAARIITVPREALKQTVNYNILTQLRHIGRMPIGEKRLSLLCIPLTVDRYWNLLPRCQAVPFVAPSITGVALLSGLPKPDCPLRNNPAINHYAVYSMRPDNDSDQVRDPAGLCMAARSKGFSQIAILMPESDDSGPVKWYHCRKLSEAHGDSSQSPVLAEPAQDK